MGFIRRIEDFTCEKCDTFVHGDGFTNHCPHCLWSKHVDDEIPGDRSSDCQGLMEPIQLLSERKGYVIVQSCIRCGHQWRNACRSDDRIEVMWDRPRH